jgi:hypothetical protein
VQWYERVVDDSGSRLIFRRGEKATSYFYSTELRFVGAGVERSGVIPLGSLWKAEAPPSLFAAEENEDEEEDEEDDEEIGLWCLNTADEAAGLAYCR